MTLASIGQHSLSPEHAKSLWWGRLDVFSDTLAIPQNISYVLHRDILEAFVFVLVLKARAMMKPL